MLRAKYQQLACSCCCAVLTPNVLRSLEVFKYQGQSCFVSDLEADQLSVKLGQIYGSLSHSLGGNVTLFTSSWLQETQIGVKLSFIKVQLNQAVQHGVIDWIHSQILMLFFQRYDP